MRWERVDKRIAYWMECHGHRYLRYSLAVVFIWFGALKPFGLSPATRLVEETVFFFPPEYFVPVLGLWEVAIGVCLIYRPWNRAGLALMAAQMLGTFLPLVVLPGEVWVRFPFVLTLEGQYIIKNFVLIAAAIVVGGTVRHKEHKTVQE